MGEIPPSSHDLTQRILVDRDRLARIQSDTMLSGQPRAQPKLLLLGWDLVSLVSGPCRFRTGSLSIYGFAFAAPASVYSPLHE